MRYTYTNGIIGMNLFGYDIETANIGGREWRLAIVEQKGAVKNRFIKSGEYENADYGEVPGTKMFWSFDHAPTLREVVDTIRKYANDIVEWTQFEERIGAKA